MKTSLIIVLALLSSSLFAQSSDTTIKGVFVGFNYDPAIFPESWRAAPINAKGELLASREIKRSKFIMAKALNKYPETVLKYVKAVYFLRQLKFYDVPYGGTNSTDMVYLVNQGDSVGYTSKYLEQTFHHEFSSILIRIKSSLLDTNEWKNANQPGFNYNDPENGVGAIRNNQSSQDLDTTLSRLGVLTQYAGSSLENDVNTIAQNLFLPEKNFWAFVARFPGIKKKTELLIGFYAKIDPVFTEQYFRKLEIK